MNSEEPNLMMALAIGAIAGFGSALLGIGGGVVIVPLLTLLMGMPIKLAAGASVAAIIPAATISVGTEILTAPDNLQLLHSGLLFVGAFFGVRLGSMLQRKVDERKLAYAFAVVLLIAALRLSGTLGQVSGGAHDAIIDALGIEHGGVGDFVFTWGLTLLIGMIGGMSSPLFGLGGGVLFVPGLMLIFALFAQDYRLARAASLVTVLLTSSYATRVQSKRGMIPWPVVKALLPGVVIGAVLGLFLIDSIDTAVLSKVMAGVLALASIRMVMMARKKRVPVGEEGDSQEGRRDGVQNPPAA